MITKESVVAADAANTWFDGEIDPRWETPAWHLPPGPGIVLLYTGAFAPWHDGHTSVINAATNLLQNKYAPVVGCFVAPDHDDYIDSKCITGYRIASRIKYILAAKISVPIWIDPFGFSNPSSVNHYEVYNNLRATLDKHGHTDKEIIFICGSDNVYLTTGFPESVRCVVVPRAGYPSSNWPNVYIANGNADVYNTSSTLIRQTNAEIAKPSRCILRVDDANELEQASQRGLDLDRQLNKFKRIDLYFRSIEQALYEYQRFIPTISLCKTISGDFNLEVHRIFSDGGIQQLDTFIGSHQIPPGTYDLFDSDIDSGRTRDLVITHLAAQGIKIQRFFCLHQTDKDTEIIDLCDLLTEGWWCRKNGQPPALSRNILTTLRCSCQLEL